MKVFSSLTNVVKNSYDVNFKFFTLSKITFDSIKKIDFVKRSNVSRGRLSLTSFILLNCFVILVQNILHAGGYTGSTCAQVSTSGVYPGATNAQIIRVAVTATNGSGSCGVTGITFTTQNTSNVDITAARCYYSGTSTTFSTATAFGSAISNPSGDMAFAGSVSGLSNNTYYFWLVYDVASGATSCTNTIDAFVKASGLVISGTGSGNYTPTTNNPAGSRTILKSNAYCSITFSTVEPITNVSFAGINNSTSNTVNGTPAYEDFSCVTPASVTAGSSYAISLSGNTNGNFTNYFSVFFDWNQDGDFSDAGERYDEGTITSTTNGAIASPPNISVPATATLGLTRMRVVKTYNAYTTSACTPGTNFGQAEDYFTNVIAPSACSGAPTAGTASSNPSSICNGNTSVISLTGFDNGSGIELLWEQSATGTGGWSTVSGGSGSTSNSYTTPGLTSTTYYRCKVTCTNSGQIAYSNVSSVSVLSATTYRTVGSVTGALYWNNASTWECGSVPPTDGTADVIIQAAPTVSLLNNFVYLPTNAINVKSITLNSNASLQMGGDALTHVIVGDLTVNSGALLGTKNWTGSGVQTLRIGGNIVNDGTIGYGYGNGGWDYVIELNGTTAQSFSGTGTSTFIGGKTAGVSQLVINNTSASGVTLGMNFGGNNNSGVAGKVVINAGSILRFSSSSIQIVNGNTNLLDLNGTTELKATTFNGHFAMTGTRTINTSTSRIIYTNAVSNLTPVTNIPWSDLGSLTTNMGTSGLLTIGGATNLYGELAMINGDISTTATNLLTVGMSASFPGSVNWTTGTVLGPLRRWYNATNNSGNTSGLFPVGNKPSSTVFNRWVRIEYTSAPTTAGYLTAEFKGIDPATTTAGMNGMSLSESSITLSNIATEGYWEVTPSTISGGVYSLTSRVNTFNSITNYTSSRIIKSPDLHTTWTLNGAHGTISGTAADYQISRTGMSGYSYFAIGYPSSVLPVELISFTATCTANVEQVKVDWVTASEHNSSHFILQRSTDGSSWENINTESAAGNSTTIQEYSFTDLDARGYDNVYYKLIQVDMDGQYKVYGPASAKCDNQSIEHRVYPNPSNGTFMLELNDANNSNIYNVQIKDGQGKVIYAKEYNTASGNGQYVIGLPEVAQGMYYLTISDKEAVTQTIKLVFR